MRQIYSIPANVKGVKDYIPHRDPFLFVDEIIEMDDSHIVTGLTLKPEMDLYRGHYPSNPITPGVILCESVFQSAGVYVAMKQELEGSEAAAGTPILTRIIDARFKRMALPGDHIRITVTPDRVQAGFHFMKGRIDNDAGQMIMSVEFAIAMK